MSSLVGLKTSLVGWAYSTGVMLCIGLVIGGALAWTIQGWRLNSAKTDYLLLIEQGRTAEQIAIADVKRNQERADAYYDDYLYIQEKRDEAIESARRALETATSDTAMCFSPDATRVLSVQQEADRRAEAQDRSPRKPSGSRSRPSIITPGSVRSPPIASTTIDNANNAKLAGPSGPSGEPVKNAISERAMGNWKNLVTEQYKALRLKHQTLGSIIEASDAFVIDYSR